MARGYSFAYAPSADNSDSDDTDEGASGLLPLFDYLHRRGSQLDVATPQHRSAPAASLVNLPSRAAEIKDAALSRVQHAAEQASQLHHERSQKFHEEVNQLRADVGRRIDQLADSWNDTRNVRLRDKWQFVGGVMTIVAFSMAICARPAWVPVLYTGLAAIYLPLRFYQYAIQRPWGYFLLDYCYASNIICLLYLWYAPDSTFLWTVSYCSAHGPLAVSVAAWRNSLVLHSVDKMTSVFIHMTPPIVFHTIHFLLSDTQRAHAYPAAAHVRTLDLATSIGFCFVVYAAWQAAYYYFISFRKAEKIRSGKRINSYSTMSANKGAIGHLISSVPTRWREPFFMFLQFVYTFLSILPAPLVFYQHARVAAGFLTAIFVVATYNGGSFYIEVFGRQFEKQLIALQRQIQETRGAEHAQDEEAAHAMSNAETAEKGASTALATAPSAAATTTTAAIAGTGSGTDALTPKSTGLRNRS